MPAKNEKNENKHISVGFSRREILLGAGCFAAACGIVTFPANAVRALDSSSDTPVFSFQTGPLGFPH